MRDQSTAAKQTHGTLEGLRVAAERASNLVVNCRFCSACCESGLVYVLPEEKTHLESVGVPIICVGDVYFIQRAADGPCPMLHRTTKQCTIYRERPVCCRLYPLDLLSRRGVLEWVLYEYCPIERKKEATLVVNNRGRMDRGMILQALRMLEDVFGRDRINYLAKEDLVASEVDVLDSHRNDYTVLGAATQGALHVEEILTENRP